MNELIEGTTPSAQIVASPTPANILQIAVAQGADIDKLEKLMAMQERWEANQARNAYNAAFSSFKAEAVQIIKSKKVTAGPLNGKSYAELHDVVRAVTPSLSRHGLSTSWKITKDEKEWIEVTCVLSHAQGHSESVSLGGPPDSGGAKNAIQARASTVTYLERYTLKAILGVAEEDDDTDGRAQKVDRQEWADAINSAATKADLGTIWQNFTTTCIQARDTEGHDSLKAAYAAKIKSFAEPAK